MTRKGVRYVSGYSLKMLEEITNETILELESLSDMPHIIDVKFQVHTFLNKEGYRVTEYFSLIIYEVREKTPKLDLDLTPKKPTY